MDLPDHDIWRWCECGHGRGRHHAEGYCLAETCTCVQYKERLPDAVPET